MHVYSKGAAYSCVLVEPPIANAGEARIYKVLGRAGVLAKVFKPQSRTPELEDKISYMLAHPPAKNILEHLAWPQELFYEKDGTFAGFTMKEFASGVDINELHPYPPKKFAALDSRRRLIISRNLSITVAGLHACGYVIGDFNPNNIRVEPSTCAVNILDVNSFQFTDKVKGRTYPCPVGYDGFIGPELLASVKGFKGYEELFHKTGSSFTEATDVFALAEHIYMLNMNGTPPFNGLKAGKRLSSVVPGKASDSIARNEYCFRAGYEPLAARTPRLVEIHPEMARMFTLAFDIGYGNPARRPSAKEWHQALGRCLKACTVKCGTDSHHYYYTGLGSCPHCEALRRHKKMAISLVAKPLASSRIPTPAAFWPSMQTTASNAANAVGNIANTQAMLNLQNLLLAARLSRPLPPLRPRHHSSKLDSNDIMTLIYLAFMLVLVLIFFGFWYLLAALSC